MCTCKVVSRAQIVQVDEAQPAPRRVTARALQPAVASFLTAISNAEPAILQPEPHKLAIPLAPLRTSFSAAQARSSHRPVLNLNDTSLLIEALPGPQGTHAKAALQYSRALLLSPPPTTRKLVTIDPIIPNDTVAHEFAHFNVSQEVLYRRQRRGRVAGMASGASSLHSPIATNLSQLPLPSSLTRDVLLQPHHPIHAFVPFDVPCAAHMFPLLLCDIISMALRVICLPPEYHYIVFQDLDVCSDAWPCAHDYSNSSISQPAALRDST